VVFVCCQISRLITFFVVISRNRISADHAGTRVARCSAVSPHIMTRLGLYSCRDIHSCTCTYESWVQKPKKAGHLFSSTLHGGISSIDSQSEVEIVVCRLCTKLKPPKYVTPQKGTKRESDTHTKSATDASSAFQRLETSDLYAHLAMNKNVHNERFHLISTRISFATVGVRKPP
jgi:hypothetical protein